MAVEEENVEDRCTTGKIKRRVFEKKLRAIKARIREQKTRSISDEEKDMSRVFWCEKSFPNNVLENHKIEILRFCFIFGKNLWYNVGKMEEIGNAEYISSGR